MKALIEKLKSLYIEPELQFRIVVTFVLLITIEGFFVGLGFMQLISLTKNWQSASLVRDFFWTLLWMLVPLILINVVIGLYWSRRLARPLHDLENGLKSLREGRLSAMIEAHPEDALNELIESFNETADKMGKIISRDQRLISEVLEDLKRGQTSKPEEVKKILLSVRSKLSVVDRHFNRGG